MAEIEPLRGLMAMDKKLMACWIREVGGLAIRGSTGSLLIEKFPRYTVRQARAYLRVSTTEFGMW